MLQKFSKFPDKLLVSLFNRLRKDLGKGYNGTISIQAPRLEGAHHLLCKRSELWVGFYVIDNGSCVNEDAVDPDKLFRKSPTLSSLKRFTYS